jgi:hypothetical protein
MSTITLYINDQHYNRGVIMVTQTKKSIKVSKGLGTAYSLYPSQGVYNTPINITFPSGKVRQVVLLWKGKAETATLTAADVNRSVLLHDPNSPRTGLLIADHPHRHWFHGRLHFIKHKDDKIYSVPRWVIVRHGRHGNELIYDLSRLNEWSVKDGYQDEVVFVKEQWLRWGDKDILYDNGFDWRLTYGQGDERCDRWTPKGHLLSDLSSKNVSEFPTNPFAEGELAAPRYRHPMPQGGFLYVKVKVSPDEAVKSFLWKREIAEAVFRPERVAKMIDRYGMEWIDTIA